jgi:hypothetical protein
MAEGAVPREMFGRILQLGREIESAPETGAL